mgnify:FL=1
MESSLLLIQSTAGLEKTMKGLQAGPLKDSTVPQISAILYYQANVLGSLTESKVFKEKFKSIVFTQIMKDFGNYVDALARTRPKSFHHVYEWNRAGDESSRLFTLNAKDGEQTSFSIGYTFKPSTSLVPNSSGNRRHVFVNKARVMEDGQPLVISPRSAERLVFDANGHRVFMPKGKSVFIKNPGGASVKNQFQMAYRKFFTGPLVGLSIKRSGFQNAFNIALTKAMQTPLAIKRIQYSFSPSVVRNMAKASANTAFGGIV